MDYSPSVFSAHGILQARMLEWVAISSSREFSQPWDQTHISYVSCIGRKILYHSHQLESPNNPVGESVTTPTLQIIKLKRRVVK